jgi:hypothetical protein
MPITEEFTTLTKDRPDRLGKVWRLRAHRNDPELSEWLRWVDVKGSTFLRTMAQAAFYADLKNYELLRPVLLELQKEEKARRKRKRARYRR